MTFNELNIAEPVLRALGEKGYETPTPIQEQAIPVLMVGRDIFGIARTGTGKTAAFAIPIILKLMEERAAKPRMPHVRKPRWQPQAQPAPEEGKPAREGDTAAEQADAAAGTDTAAGTDAAALTDAAAGTALPRSHSRRRGRRHGKPARQRVIRALVLTPTRELALQISDCFTDYSKYTDLEAYGRIRRCETALAGRETALGRRYPDRHAGPSA